jgi:glc operon protein GlcG
MSTADLAERVAKGAPFWTHVGSVLSGQILPSHGAVPIVVKGHVIGAIGCGGGTGEQDQECAAAGAAVLA